MKIKQTYVLDAFSYPQSLQQFIPEEDFALFDIETTGLSHSKSEVILIGYIVCEQGKFSLHQIFCENRSEERDLLDAFRQVIEERKYLISYNGRAFDIPFLNSRYRHYGIPFEIHKFLNLDLMRLVKANKDHFDFDDFKLKTVEKFLGIEREDTITGKESVELYNLYEQNRNSDLEHKILLHNYEDILYLLKCLEIVNYVSPDTMYQEVPLTIRNSRYSAYLSQLDIRGDRLYATLWSDDFSTRNYSDFLSEVTVEYAFAEKTLKVGLPLFRVQSGDHRLKFADVDLMEGFSIHFNDLPHDEKLKFLIEQDSLKIHHNIYRLIALYSEHLHQ